jgi:transmembrane sensor
MNQPHPSSESDVDELAALWAARLDGSTLSPSDRASLEAWLAGDKRRGELFSRYRDLSSDLGQVLPALVAAGAVESPRPRERESRRGWAPGWMAAAALACAAVAAAVWLGMPGPRPESIATASAQRRSFTLSDGTVVELNANTSAQFDNGRSERHVRLAEGEAYFVVTKDKARPFTVETPSGSVRVTGTVFNVRSSEESALEVTVVEGTVLVSPGGPGSAGAASPKVLGAGDQLTALAGSVNVRALRPGDVDDAIAWRRGLIVCKGMPLSEAAARFARFNGLRITVTPGAIRQTAGGIGGVFSIDDPASFYEDLGAMYHVRVTRGPDGSARVSSTTEP